MKISPNTSPYPILGEPCLTPSHESIARFNQMISSEMGEPRLTPSHESIASFNQMMSFEMDHIELALYNLLSVLINLDFILCIFT
jgi:hypothetical protein